MQIVDVIGLGHVSFYVDDLAKARAFYQEVFGFREISVSLGESDGSTMVFLENGPVTIELVGFHVPPHRQDGLIDHLCLRVADIKETQKRLQAFGFAEGCEIGLDQDIYPNGGLFMIFRGPCGERLQVEQRL